MPRTVMIEDRDLAAPVEPTEAPTETSQAPAGVLAFLDPIDALSPPGSLGTREEIEKELDLVAAAIRSFHRKQSDQVMREVAGYSARLTELCVLLHRVEGSDRRYTRIRTQQVERFLAELDRQFKIASRLVEVMRLDLELMK